MKLTVEGNRAIPLNGRFHLERRGTGGANRDRTGDLLLAKQALSQLSYGPAEVSKQEISPETSWWWVWVDLNHRPHAYQACALTN